MNNGFKMLKYVLILFSVIFLNSCSASSDVIVSDDLATTVSLNINVDNDDNYFVVIKTNKNESFKFDKLKKDKGVESPYDYTKLDSISANSKLIYFANKSQKIKLYKLIPATDYFIDIISKSKT